MISKQTLLVISGVGTLSFLLLSYAKEVSICPAYDFSNCSFITNSAAQVIFPLVLLFLFGLFTCSLRNQIYEAWFRFARWWVPLSMIAIFLAPEYSNDWVLPIEKGGVALVFCGTFVLISTLIITRAFFFKRTV